MRNEKLRRRVRERRDFSLRDPLDYSSEEEYEALAEYKKDRRRKEAHEIRSRISQLLEGPATCETEKYLGWLKFCLWVAEEWW